MSLTINTQTPAGMPWFKAPLDNHLEWRKAARRIWAFLKHPDRQAQVDHHFTDAQLARILGVSRRTIQYGLYWLKKLGAILTHWVYGEGGHRVIVVTLQLATASTKPPGAPATPPQAPGSTTTKAKPKIGPAPGPAQKRTTPEQQALVDAQVAAAQETPPGDDDQRPGETAREYMFRKAQEHEHTKANKPTEPHKHFEPPGTPIRKFKGILNPADPLLQRTAAELAAKGSPDPDLRRLTDTTGGPPDGTPGQPSGP